MGYSLWNCKELDMTDKLTQTHTKLLFSWVGGGGKHTHTQECVCTYPCVHIPAHLHALRHTKHPDHSAHVVFWL